MAITTPKFDLNAWFAGVAGQFQGLNPKEPGQWPLAPKLAASLVVMVAVIVAGYVFVLSDVQAGLDAAILLAGLPWVPWQRVALSLLGMAAINAALAINHRPGRYMAT